MNKILDYKIRTYGIRGLQIYLPRVYVKDNDLKASDELSVFRTRINKVDVLVLVPSNKQNLIEPTNGKFNV